MRKGVRKWNAHVRAQCLKSERTKCAGERASAQVGCSNEHARARAECAGQRVTAHFHMFIFKVIYFAKYDLQSAHAHLISFCKVTLGKIYDLAGFKGSWTWIFEVLKAARLKAQVSA